MKLNNLHNRIIDSCKKLQKCDKFKNLKIPNMSISDNIGLIFFDFLTILPIKYDVSKLREAYMDYLFLLNSNLSTTDMEIIEIIVKKYNLDNLLDQCEDLKHFLHWRFINAFINTQNDPDSKKIMCELIFTHKLNELKKDYHDDKLNIFNIGVTKTKIDQILVHEFYFSQIFDFQMYDDFILILDCKSNKISVRDKVNYIKFDDTSDMFKYFINSLKDKLSNTNSAFYMHVAVKYKTDDGHALMCIFNNDNNIKSFQILDPNSDKNIDSLECEQETLFNDFASIMEIKYNGFISDEYADLNINTYINTSCSVDNRGMCMFWADYFVKILYMNPNFNPSDIQYIMSNIPKPMRELVIKWIYSEITNYLFNTDYIKLIDLFYNLSCNHSTINFTYASLLMFKKDNPNTKFADLSEDEKTITILKIHEFPVKDPIKFIYQVMKYKDEIIKSLNLEMKNNYNEQLQKMIDGIVNIEHIYMNFVQNCKNEIKSVLKDFMCNTESDIKLRDLKEQIYNKKLVIKVLQQT